MGGHTVLQEVDRIMVEQCGEMVARAEAAAATFTQEAAAIRSAPIPTRTVTKYIVGFPIEVEESVPQDSVIEGKERAAAACREEAQTIRAIPDVRQKIYGWATEWGLRPIAVLPRGLWVALCRRFNLYRFECFNSDGEVPAIRQKVVKRLADRLERRARILAIFVVSMGGSYGGYLGWWSGNAFLDKIFMVFAAGVAGLAVGTLGGWGMYKLNQSLMRQWLKWRGVSAKRIVPLLWPEGCDREGDSRIAVRFPAADEEFMATLHQVVGMGLTPCVAAVPSAIQVDTKLLGAGVVGVLEERERERRRRDPILYLYSEGMVVVLAQNGEFADEKAVLEWIRQEGYSTS